MYSHSQAKQHQLVPTLQKSSVSRVTWMDGWKVEHLSLCCAIRLKSKGDDGLQRMDKAVPEARHVLVCSTDGGREVILLLFCLCLCSYLSLESGRTELQTEKKRTGERATKQDIGPANGRADEGQVENSSPVTFCHGEQC